MVHKTWRFVQPINVVFLLNFREVTCHIWNLFITWQPINIHDWAEAHWFVVESNRGAPKLLRLPSATAWWTRDQPERSSADLVIDGLTGMPRGYRMDKIAIRKRPQTKIDRKLQQQIQMCCGKFKCIIMTTAHAGVCAVRRGIDVKTKNGLHIQGLEVVKSVNRFALPGAWEKIDSSTVNQMKIFWLTCFGVTKFIEELFHDATKYVLEKKLCTQPFYSIQPFYCSFHFLAANPFIAFTPFIW